MIWYLRISEPMSHVWLLRQGLIVETSSTSYLLYSIQKFNSKWRFRDRRRQKKTRAILGNPCHHCHVLASLIPPENTHSYNLRTRRTNLQLPPPNTNSDKISLIELSLGWMRPSSLIHWIIIQSPYLIILLNNNSNNSLVYSYFPICLL